MSFAIRRLAVASRTAVVSAAPRASFTSASCLNKSATETVKDGIKKVDRAVSDKLVDGIDVAASVGEKVKEASEEVASGEAASKAEQYRREAAGKMSELAGEAKGKANEMSGKAKGKTAELKGQADGKAEEIKRKM